MMCRMTPLQISAVDYTDLRENYGGFCTACGDQAHGVEPDARKYVCESCGQPAVYGVEELLACGLILFAGLETDK